MTPASMNTSCHSRGVCKGRTLSLCITDHASQRTYLFLRHQIDYDGTEHASQRAKAIGDAHQDAGIARRYIQVVHVETCESEFNCVRFANTQTIEFTLLETTHCLTRLHTVNWQHLKGQHERTHPLAGTGSVGSGWTLAWRATQDSSQHRTRSAMRSQSKHSQRLAN